MKKVTVIGTSPISIIEAIHRQKNGEKVIVLEAKNHPGGAWGTVVYKHIPEVEVGCHIWSYNRNAYKFVEDAFNLDLKPLVVQPKIYFKGVLIPYDWKQSMFSFQKLMKASLTFKKSAFKGLKQSPDFRMGLFPSKYLYPKNGAKDLKNSVINLIEKESLSIKFNCEAKAIKVLPSGVEVSVENQLDAIISDHVVLTSLTEFDSITLENGEVIIPEKRKVEYIHRHLLINDSKGKKFSYIRCMNHSLVHRISDMTSQVVNELKEGQKLICVGVFEKGFHNTAAEEQEIQIMSLLKKMKLIGEEASLVVSESNIYPSFYSDYNLMDEIQKKSNDKISFLRSTDFIYSFYNHLDRYRNSFPSNSN